MEHCCRLPLVSSKLVRLQTRLTCETLPAESKCILDSHPREGKKVRTNWANIGMVSDQSERVDE